MTILIYNTLTAKKEEFRPLNDESVTMYICGVTPYDEVHLGHARAYVTFDVVRRHMEQWGYSVRYVQNFTDVDDKILRRAHERNISPRELADRYIADYFTQMDRLNIRRADSYPRVTENIPAIIAFIRTLIEKKKAYAVGGDVYYSVKKFPGYGKLSKRNVDELEAGARVEVDEQKKDPLDFALWKQSKPGEPGEASWDSPWGKGRPGWHIECSVMSTALLGPTLDIHGGGQDLIFPHHENEIAQSEAATGQPFVRYWMHNGFVTVNREKMSKSLGNFFTLREIFKRFQPRVVRYFLLSQHYRSPLDFSDDKLSSAARALKGIDEACLKLAAASDSGARCSSGVLPEVVHRFRCALNDDFNTERALAIVHELKNDVLNAINEMAPRFRDKAYLTMKSLMQDYLGIPLPEPEALPGEILSLKAEREKARAAKNWSEADRLRKELALRGYRAEDNPDGSSTVLKNSD